MNWSFTPSECTYLGGFGYCLCQVNTTFIYTERTRKLATFCITRNGNSIHSIMWEECKWLVVVGCFLFTYTSEISHCGGWGGASPHTMSSVLDNLRMIISHKWTIHDFGHTIRVKLSTIGVCQLLSNLISRQQNPIWTQLLRQLKEFICNIYYAFTWNWLVYGPFLFYHNHR